MWNTQTKKVQPYPGKCQIPMIPSVMQVYTFSLAISEYILFAYNVYDITLVICTLTLKKFVSFYYRGFGGFLGVLPIIVRYTSDL